MATAQVYAFKDASGLALWSTWLLYVQAGVAVFALWSGWQEYQLLQSMQDGTFQSQTDLISLAEASDRRQQIVGISQLALFAINGILILIWIWRANANARALGAVRMDYTPGWSVGWYFVPLANLSVPYLAMRDIWKASARPEDPQAVNTPFGWFPVWWAFWLATAISGNVSLRLALNAETLQEIQTVSLVTMLSDALRIPLCLIFPVIVAQVQRMQTERASRTGSA